MLKQNMKNLVKVLLLLITLSSCNDKSTEPHVWYIEDPVPPLDEYPAWSPDGTRIVYSHNGIVNISEKTKWGYTYDVDLDRKGLWIVNADGSNPHMLIKSMGIFADWSPDGKWIVFETGGQIYKAPVSGDSLVMSQVVQLTTEGGNFFPAWSPDGEWIAFDSNLNDENGAHVISKIRNDASDRTDISQHGIGEWRMPHWSPDGKKIVFKNYINDAGELFIMNSDGSELVRLSHLSFFESYPKWSPEGTCIVFNNQLNPGSGIYTIHTNGTGLKRLAQGTHPDWSPDGSQIIYVKDSLDDPKNNTLWIMNRNGSGNRQLTFYHQP